MLPINEKKVLSGNGFAFLRFGAWQYPTAVIRKTFPAGYLQYMHFHDFPQVWYCHAGHYLHQIGQNVYDCTGGDLIVVPSGIWHGFLVPEDSDADIFCIEVKYSVFMDTSVEKYLNAAANLLLPCFSKELDHSFPEVVRLSPQSAEQAAAVLSDLSLLDYRSANTDMSMIHGRLEDLFSLPEMEIPQRRRRKALRLVEQKAQPIVRTMAYLNENYAHKIVAEDLMWVAALCHTDFYKCFKRFSGLTFSDYLLQLRIARVDILLRSTTYSFSRIAELCGFGDAAHMSKSYKKHKGMLLKDVRARASSRPETQLRGASHKLRDRGAV